MKTRVHPRVWIKWGDAGEKITVAEAARRVGIMPGSLWHRLERGVPREKLLAPSWALRPECAPKNAALGQGRVLDTDPAKRGVRRPTFVEAKAVAKKVEQHGSPLRAAMDGALTADEYLAAEAWRDFSTE